MGSVFADVAATEAQRLGQGVVSVADVRARVRLEGLRQVVEGCEGEACGGQTARLGEMFEVDNLLRGSVARASSGYVVTLSLLRSSDGAALARFEGSAGSEVMLQSTIRRGVRVILGREFDPAAVGILSIRTERPGARVEVDGEFRGRSPLTLRGCPAGDHELVLTSSSARVVHPVLVEPGQLARVDLDLEHPPVTLHLFSDPDGAVILRDGEQFGRAPMLLEDVPAEPIQLEFVARGHRRRIVSVDLRAEERAHPGLPITVEAELEPEWPVGLGAIVGVVSDAGAVADGVAFSGEVTVDLGDHVQIGAGGTVPASVFGALRLYALRDGFELGALARVAGVLSTAPSVPDDARTTRLALQGGLVLGWSGLTPAGRVGFLVEGGPAFDLDGHISLPVTAAGQWRFR